MFITLEETISKINEGKILHIAADESLLCRLPKGKWIGGTTPYFISDEGGILSKEVLCVNEIDYAEDFNIVTYSADDVFKIVEDSYDNGLAIIIMPFGSEVSVKYAREAPDVEELFMHPVIGWLSGSDLNDRGEMKVYNGSAGESYTDKAVVMYIKLPEGKTAMINMIKIFTDDKSEPAIRFHDNNLSAEKCTVDGEEVSFAEYIDKKGVDPRMPLVADYNGAYINTSIKGVENGVVEFYGPVFKDIEYRFAKNVEDYTGEFLSKIEAAGNHDPVFTCNCILNFVYGNLAGIKIPSYTGPVTFGEVAYQLVNQTLVYCEILG